MKPTALITGASRGIGRAIALRLAEAGMRVFANGRDEACLDETCQLVRRHGGEAHSYCADISDHAAIQRMVDWAAEDGGIDVLVHCAGIGGQTPITKPDFALWDRMLDVDLRAPMHLTGLALPHVSKRQGIIVFVGSVAGKLGIAGSSAYCAAKHGIDGFASALFEEVRELGVRVVRVHPGDVNTDMTAGRDLDPTKMIQPSDVADLVLTAIRIPPTACVVEMIVRPQRTPDL